MRGLCFDACRGDFAENLTTQGLQLASLPVGTGTPIGKDALFHIAQFGKDCHSGSAICHQIGKCIMPKEGVFPTVIRGGFVRARDSTKVVGGKDEKGS